MARIEGVDLPREKRVEVGLTYIYGIGPAISQRILRETKVSPDTRIKDLTEAEVTALRDYIGKHFTVEGDLRREVQMNIKRLVEIGCYRGLRHRRNLPVRGQRTRTNSRTRKGPKKTVAGRGRRRGAKKK
ncbi:MAG TPA: 30S ribosomal protein S13 [Anaerolineales bacterium]|jgi:small subunit ribosomal protein S13